MRLNQEMKDKMKEMYASGKTFAMISKELDINATTVRFNCSDKARLKNLEENKVRQRGKPQNMNKGLYRSYQKEYHNRRYAEDEEFRKKHILAVQKSYSKLKEEKNGKNII